MFRGTRSLLGGTTSRVSTTRTLRSFPRAFPSVLGPACPPVQRHPSSLRQLPMAWRISFSTKPPVQPNQRDEALEKELAKKKLEARPEEVSTESSVRHVFEPSQTTAKGTEDVLQGAKNDLKKVQETFALTTVPREPYALGLAGTLPYLATSLCTVYLSWDLTTGWPTSSQVVNSLMVSSETATQWLSALEPIQVGYGAVIISFLGAIHWGLEYAEKKPDRKRTQFRYGVGLLAPTIAWPTMMLPIEWALISQFMTFIGLYFVDARATTRGWTPAWYGTYRFALTAIVGAAIVLTLVARARIDDKSPRITSDDIKTRGMHTKEQPYVNWARLEAEEKEEKEKEQKEKEKEKKKEKKQKGAKDKKAGKSEKADTDESAEDSSEEDKPADGQEKKEDKKGKTDSKDEGKDKKDSKDEGKDKKDSKEEGKDKKDNEKEENESDDGEEAKGDEEDDTKKQADKDKDSKSSKAAKKEKKD